LFFFTRHSTCLGNLLSLFILFKPSTSSYKLAKLANDSKRPLNRRYFTSFDYKLNSFYLYLKALSICDLFSCIFAIINISEHLPSPYSDPYPQYYRSWCLNVSVYTHGISSALQALSVWIICAFSIHRCRSILKSSSILTTITKKRKSISSTRLASVVQAMYKKRRSNNDVEAMRTAQNKCTENLDLTQICKINLNNNCNGKIYVIKFYKKPLVYMFGCFGSKAINRKSCCFKMQCCVCKTTTLDSQQSIGDGVKDEARRKLKKKRENKNANNDKAIDSDKKSSEPAPAADSERVEVSSLNKKQNLFRKKLNKSRNAIILLYVIALAYYIPQIFEKRVVRDQVRNKMYEFRTITKFGQSRLFKQIFHLWIFFFAVYIVPFIIIFFFNFLLLRSFLISKKRCQRYKLRADANRILRDYNLTVAPSDGAESRASPKISTAAVSKNQLKTNNNSNHNNNNNNSNNLNVINAYGNLSDARYGMKKSPSLLSDGPSTASFYKYSNCPSANTNSNLQASIKPDANRRRSSRSKALTLTLFGVVAIFFVFHLPAAVARIIYVFFPKAEFQGNLIPGILLDLANFLIMLNSSINFLLYIVFGPGKFRDEFRIILHRFCKCFRRGTAESQQQFIATNNLIRIKEISISNTDFSNQFNSYCKNADQDQAPYNNLAQEQFV
jgi:hypothetical protein